MKKAIGRGAAAVVLLGALSGVLGGGAVSAADCYSAGPLYLCNERARGVRIAGYSDVVEVHTSVVYGSTKETGILIGDGFTNNASGALVWCDTAKKKYQLTYVINGSFRSRTLPVGC